MCGCRKHHDSTAICTCICPEHANFKVAFALAMDRHTEIQRLRAELRTCQEAGADQVRQVEDLQRLLAEASGQTEAAKQAAREIMAERNTWARQLADMRDERDTAQRDLEQFKETNSEALDWATSRVANLEVAIERVLDSVKPTGDPFDTLEQIKNLRRVHAQDN